MTGLRNYCVWPLVWLSLLLLPSRCFSAPVYQITEQQLTELESSLTVLEQNNGRLQMLLTQSQTDLGTASNQSDVLSSQVRTLKSQLGGSQKQTITLRNQLTALQQQTANARSSLQTANDELAKAASSYKQYEALQKRTQQRLDRQRDLWAIAACLLGGGFIYKS